jgi:hypothetical protein
MTDSDGPIGLLEANAAAARLGQPACSRLSRRDSAAPNTVPNINIRRLLSGGLCAGLVIFAITGLLNGVILSAPLQSWVLGMADHLHPPTFPIALLLWLVMSCLVGTSGVWVFAAIVAHSRSRAVAAMRAGVLVWGASKAAVALDFLALGILPTSIVVGQVVGGLVAIVVGVYGGARIYGARKPHRDAIEDRPLRSPAMPLAGHHGELP